jgi:hypothetical protein
MADNIYAQSGIRTRGPYNMCILISTDNYMLPVGIFLSVYCSTSVEEDIWT